MDFLKSLIVDAQVICLNDTTLVMHIKKEGISPQQLYSPKNLALKIKIGNLNDLRHRALIDHKNRVLPGALPLWRMQLCRFGQSLERLFLNNSAFEKFLMANLNYNAVKKFAQQMERCPVLLTWCELMHGNVNDLPLKVRKTNRSKLEKQLKHDYGKFSVCGVTLHTTNKTTIE